MFSFAADRHRGGQENPETYSYCVQIKNPIKPFLACVNTLIQTPDGFRFFLLVIFLLLSFQSFASSSISSSSLWTPSECIGANAICSFASINLKFNQPQFFSRLLCFLLFGTFTRSFDKFVKKLFNKYYFYVPTSHTCSRRTCHTRLQTLVPELLINTN